MLTGEIRNQIDSMWNAFWTGGISNPLEVIEQITYLLFLKGKIIHKKAEVLNGDLVKASAYDKNEQKQVTAWLGVRNEAAHGNYGNVDAAVVGLMIAGIRSFTARFPT